LSLMLAFFSLFCRHLLHDADAAFMLSDIDDVIY